eukprot:TRINITY_DN61416_c0_g1_i1.p1 TRINITY_DN61416_c0_g1~~TRINITY_DN61416_c0_g1_i1.p1  ORF type:complete len:254 (-),score=48.51 TRINITY_DN61416_c0_g1_i1:67-828(-)
MVLASEKVVDVSSYTAGDSAPSLKQLVVHQNPLIAVCPNFVTDDEIQHLLGLAEGSWFPSAVDEVAQDAAKGGQYVATGIHRRSEQKRSSDSCVLKMGQTRTVQAIERRLCSLTGMNLKHLECMAMVRYAPGQFFKCHHDGGIRPWTVFLYLNDLPAGAAGETHFPELRLRVRPSKGCAVLWPNRLPDGQADPRLVHEGLPPKSGVKYGVNCFFNVKVLRPKGIEEDHADGSSVQDDDDDDEAETSLFGCWSS